MSAWLQNSWGSTAPHCLHAKQVATQGPCPLGAYAHDGIKITEIQLFAAFHLSCPLDMIFVWLYSASSSYSLSKKALICLPSCCVLCEWESKRNRKKKRTINLAKGWGPVELIILKKDSQERRESSCSAWRQSVGKESGKTLRYFEKLYLFPPWYLRDSSTDLELTWNMYSCHLLCSF